MPAILSCAFAASAQEVDYRLPDSVSVLPVFFVAQGVGAGAEPPSIDQSQRLMRHLAWTQRNYAEWLGGTTFRIAVDTPQVYRGEQSLGHYRESWEAGAAEVTAELLGHYGFNRFNVPYVFLVVVMNPRDRFPVGGGRPLNGGFNTGGGIVFLSSYLLDSLPNFQSTLEHELGHSFGLPHVDVYGYDQARGPSIMSYNQDHLTNHFAPAPSPGSLIAEDVRGLSVNHRVFPDLEPVSPSRDLIWLGPMEIPGQPPYAVEVTTTSGETFASSVQNIVLGRIKPSRGPGVTYDPNSMWASDSTTDGWVSVDVTFPFRVALTRMRIHSEHSGRYHPATAARIAIFDENDVVLVAEQDLSSADACVEFARRMSRRWQLSFRASESQMVTIRGLEFFDGDKEVFPPPVPYEGPGCGVP